MLFFHLDILENNVIVTKATIERELKGMLINLRLSKGIRKCAKWLQLLRHRSSFNVNLFIFFYSVSPIHLIPCPPRLKHASLDRLLL